MRSLQRPDPRRRLRGFTLVELVTVLVIVGVLAALAVPRLQNMRSAARAAAIRSFAAQIQSSMATTISLWHLRGTNPVVVGGQSIAVYDAGFDPWGDTVPNGAPTGNAMYVLSGCGDTPPPPNTVSTCPHLPGYSLIIWDGAEFTIWPSEIAQPTGLEPSCYVDYTPAYNHDPGWSPPGYNNPYTTVVVGMEIATSGC